MALIGYDQVEAMNRNIQLIGVGDDLAVFRVEHGN
jgi:hypothetical protein